MDNNENNLSASAEPAQDAGAPAASPKKGKKQKAVKANKKKKKEKKEKPEGLTPTVFLEQKYGAAVPTVGLFLRALVAAVTAFGFTAMFYEAICEDTARGMLFLTAIAFAALTALCFLGKKRKILGTVLIAVGIVLPVLLALKGDGITLIPNAFASFWNQLNGMLEKYGFTPIIGFIGTGVAYADRTLCAFYWITAATSVVLTASVARRVKLFPVVCLCVVYFTIPFTYNLVNDAFGFLFTVAGIAALLITFLSEKSRAPKTKKHAVKQKKADGKLTKEEKKKAAVSAKAAKLAAKAEKKTKAEKSAEKAADKAAEKAAKKANEEARTDFPGGFTAAVSLLLCLAILLPIYAGYNKPWKNIPSISKKMEYTREVVTAILTGQPIDPNFRGYDPTDEREVTASKRKFEMIPLYQVNAGYEVPVYLRNWVGGDYENGAWKGISKANRNSYLNDFPDFDGDSITGTVLGYMLPGAIYSSQTKQYGYYRSDVTVRRLEDSYTRSLPIPVRPLQTGGVPELKAVPGMEDALPSVTAYYDGVFLTDLKESVGEAHTVTALLPAYDDSRFLSSFTSLLDKLATSREIIDVASGIGWDDSYLTSYGIGNLKEYPILEAYLSDETVMKWISEFYEQLQRYESYVDSHYTEKADSKTARTAARRIAFNALADIGKKPSSNLEAAQTVGQMAKDPRNFAFIHEIVLDVVQYLSDTCQYTLTPEPYHGTLTDPVDIFLDGNRQGYCVQYATAACVMLRELGIPTRYVEGYVTGKLRRAGSPAAGIGSYTATVLDSDAHAWIEIYIPGFGWMDYETTETFTDTFYGTGGSGTTDDPDPWQRETEPRETEPLIEDTETTDPDETRPPKETEPETDEEGNPVEETDPLAFLPLLIAVGIIAVVAALFFLIRSIREKRLIARESLAACVNESLHGEPGDYDRTRFGHTLNDRISAVCAITGMERGRNELAEDYAARIDATLAETPDAPYFLHSFTEIVPLMEKAEFGAPLDANELHILAEFYLDLSDEARKRLNPLEKLWYVKIKEIL